MQKSIPIDINGCDVLETGTFKNGQDFQIVELFPEYIQTMLLFQKLILATLKPEEEAYYNEKSKNFLTKHFNTGSKAIAVVSNGQMLGQALIVYPSKKHPEDGMTDMAKDWKPDVLSVIQGLCAHPEARGCGIGSKLIETWLKISKQDGKTQALAETEQHNHYSWGLFLKHGVSIVGEGVDPSDGAKLFNHHKLLKETKLKEARVVHVYADPFAHYHR